MARRKVIIPSAASRPHSQHRCRDASWRPALGNYRTRRPFCRYLDDPVIHHRVGLDGGTALTSTRLARPLNFGEFLRYLRDERRLSRERLAMHSEVSASYINHLECGRRDRPTQIVVQALLACLHRISPVPDESRNHLFVLAGLRSYTTSNTRAHQDGGVGSI